MNHLRTLYRTLHADWQLAIALAAASFALGWWLA